MSITVERYVTPWSFELDPIDRLAELEEKKAALRFKAAQCDELRAENDKLRELATMLYRCARGMLRDLTPSCVDRSKEGCGMDCTDNGERCCMELLERRMRELGIEVDG